MRNVHGGSQGVPGWAWDPKDQAWEDSFARVLAYAEREGHSRVPGSYQVDGQRLGRWVIKQRAARKRGDLSSDRVRRLESLPGWTWDTGGTKWEEGYAHLLRFLEDEGHSRVPQSYRSADGYALGAWLGKQRQRRDQLSEEHLKLLEVLPGWTWQPRAGRWEDGFTHLESYVRRNGHSRVPDAYRDGDGYLLGDWVGRQRASRRGGHLSDERRRRLEALPGWTWDAKQQRD